MNNKKILHMSTFIRYTFFTGIAYKGVVVYGNYILQVLIDNWVSTQMTGPVNNETFQEIYRVKTVDAVCW